MTVERKEVGPQRYRESFGRYLYVNVSKSW